MGPDPSANHQTWMYLANAGFGGEYRAALAASFLVRLCDPVRYYSPKDDDA